MAISGSFEIGKQKYTNIFGSVYQLTLVFDWEIISQSVENNTSTIAWQVNAHFSNLDAYLSDVKYEIIIDDQFYSGSCSGKHPSTGVVTFVSDTTTIPHNLNGTKTFLFNGYFSNLLEGHYGTPAVYFNGIVKNNNTFELDPIPRLATITEASDFNDEENPIIFYDNPAGEMVDSLEACISFDEDTEDISYREIPKTDTSYTFNLTEEERVVLRQGITQGNSRIIRFKIRTIIYGETFSRDQTATLSLVNHTPTLTPVIEDVNSKTLALTGNKNTLVKYVSNAKFSSGAAARKEAEVVSQYVQNGEVLKNDMSGGTIEGVKSNSFTFGVTDSRGFTTIQTATKNFIEYIKPTISLESSTPTSLEDVRITLKGRCYVGSFGAVNNTIAIQYRYAAKNYPYGDWITVTPTFVGNTYNTTFVLPLDDYALGYNVEAKVVDKLFTVTTPVTTIKNLPVFDWGEEDFNFNVPVTMTVGHMKYPLMGIVNAMTKAREFSVSVNPGANYIVGSGTAWLIGNTLRCYYTASRSSATGAGNIANETMLTFNVSHRGEITNMLNVGFVNGATGGLASLQTSNISMISDTDDAGNTVSGVLTFDIQLLATESATTEFSGFFQIPVTIDLEKFV